MRESFRASRLDLDDEMFRDRLLALGAYVGDAAEDVRLGHVAGRAAGRDLVPDGAVAEHGPLGSGSGEARDIHEVELSKAWVVHVTFVHEHDRPQTFQSS